jgi:type I restriction enzyme, S subunit
MAEALRLGNHCYKIGSGATPRGGKEAYLESGVISLVRSQNVHNDGFSFDGIAYIDQDQADGLRNVELFPLDVLVNITGDSVARVCQVHPDVLPARVNQHVAIVRPKPNEIDPTFLRYWLVTPYMQSYLLGLAAAGATRNALTKSMLEGLPVPATEISVQRSIANFLCKLDDKIELNRRMNETLEGMAQAIFKDWFVDFGPVRRKLAGITDPAAIMGGLTPTRAAELAALFPDRFGDDGLPEGWGSAELNKSLVLQRGFDLPKTTRTDGIYPVIAASGPSGTHNEFKVQGPGVCTGRSGVLGGIFFVREDFWPLNTSLWIKEYPNSTPLYAFYLLKTLDLLALNAGSAVPTLNRNHVHQIPVITPPMPIVREFENLSKLTYDRIGTADQENKTLAETRDYLLPKLMSGDVRVRDVEAAI